MRISYNWLKDYIDIKLPVEKVAETLTMAGLTVDAIHHITDDAVFEIEVTANRPDWLSHIGVARELSAITGAKLKLPGVKPQSQKTAKPQVAVKIEDKKLCPRYTARIIRDVKVGESPAWLKTKLEAMGLRSVNNVVDITNFCLFETGEPMHAFDLDKIEGGEITVRNAKHGEKIVTIDGIERTLNGSDLVIADSKKAVAIAGVMGGLNTEVNYSTKNILLEAACFDPISTRRTARRLALSTDSSYRFERKVDIANILYSSDRASGLITEIAAGVVDSLIDIGARAPEKNTVTLEYKKLNSILGAEIAPAKVKKILVALGLKLKSSTKEKVSFQAPAFRYDLNKEIDLVEEVARIYGYDKIPVTIPAVLDQPERLPANAIIEKKIRTLLTSLGMDEIITYSLVGRKVIKMASIPEEGIVEILNPLTAEQEVMRPSLIPGLINAILWNMNRKTKDLKLFELGCVYIKEADNKFSEKKFLSLGFSGEISSWLGGSRQVTFFDLKGAVEDLFLQMGIKDFSFKYTKEESFSGAACASIEIEGELAGIMGEPSKKVLHSFDIKDTVYICELSVDVIMKHVELEKRFVEPAKYPSVWRDISIIASKDISNADLVSLMHSTAPDMLKKIRLIDRYEGKQIPDGKESLTYRLEYQDLHKTLEEKQVSETHARILRALEEKFGAKLR